MRERERESGRERERDRERARTRVREREGFFNSKTESSSSLPLLRGPQCSLIIHQIYQQSKVKNLIISSTPWPCGLMRQELGQWSDGRILPSPSNFLF